MKASELRIGNHAKSVLAGNCRINRSNLACFEEKDWQPIPLTEEWLVKFGFEKVTEGDNNNWFRGGGRYWVQEHTEVNDFIFYGENSSIEKCIESIHQLQNIYHALTGEELTIKKIA